VRFGREQATSERSLIDMDVWKNLDTGFDSSKLELTKSASEKSVAWILTQRLATRADPQVLGMQRRRIRPDGTIGDVHEQRPYRDR
jgi:hypothetical protein